MVISLAMICSRQKQDAVAEQQLAQRKVELDTREDALIEREKVVGEREKALDGREKALTEREKATANAQMIPPGDQGQIPDPTQTQAERDRKIQEIAAAFRAMVPDSGKDRITKERLSQAQDALKELMRSKQPKWQMSGAAVTPALEAISPTPSPTPQ
jgi:uncharacterized protein (DUF3084 family)